MQKIDPAQKTFTFKNRHIKTRLRIDPVERFYYHLSSCNFGDSIVFHPRINGPCRAEEEPKIPRICVAPSVFLCLCAINPDFDLNIYRTVNSLPTVIPTGVSDSRITHERWVLNKTKFSFVGKVDKKIQKLVWDIWKKTSKEESHPVEFGSTDSLSLCVQNKFKNNLKNALIERGLNENLQKSEIFSETT